MLATALILLAGGSLLFAIALRHMPPLPKPTVAAFAPLLVALGLAGVMLGSIALVIAAVTYLARPFS